MAKLLLINGPNLNLLGTREPEVYGHTTLSQVENNLTISAEQAGHTLKCVQSNAEHEIISAIHAARTDEIEFIIINPAAFTHTSIAIRDALAGVDIPFVEIHISNIHKRESFRHHSYLSDIAEGVICGLGIEGYNAALKFALSRATP